MNKMAYGLDIGGTKMELAIYDAQFNLVDTWRVATPAGRYEEFLSAITDQIAKADQHYGQQNSVGIAMPGISNQAGEQISSNVPCLRGQRVSHDLSARLNRVVRIENDCRCFAYSEAVSGAGSAYRRVFGAILGTGAAGALCIDKQLYQSANNIAGEYGHLPISAAVFQRYSLPLWRCGCGLLGCAEPYISGTGLANIFSHYQQEDSSTYQWRQALQSGNKNALAAFDCYMSFLGSSFASLVLNYDPDVIVVGGGLSLVDEIMMALPAAVSTFLFNGVTPPPIVLAQFGDASGKRGAALLGARHAE